MKSYDTTDGRAAPFGFHSVEGAAYVLSFTYYRKLMKPPLPYWV